MSDCVNDSEPVNIQCVIEAARDVISGDFGVITIRKVIRQVDNALSLFGDELPVMAVSHQEGVSLEQHAQRVIAELEPPQGELRSAVLTSVPQDILRMLLEFLLKLLLERLK